MLDAKKTKPGLNDRYKTLNYHEADFKASLKLLRNVDDGRGQKNRKRQEVLNKYPLVNSAFLVLQKKALKIEKKKKYFFGDWSLVGAKADTARIEKAVPNMIAILDRIAEWEKYISTQNLSDKNKASTRNKLDKCILNLAYTPMVHSKTRNTIVVVGCSILIGVLAGVVSYFTGGLSMAALAGLSPTIFAWIGIGAAASGVGVLAKFPLATAGEELIYQCTKDSTNLFHGFVDYNGPILEDVIDSLKATDLNNPIEVTNTLIAKSGRSLSEDKSEKLKGSLDKFLNKFTSARKSHQPDSAVTLSSNIQKVEEQRPSTNIKNNVNVKTICPSKERMESFLNFTHNDLLMTTAHDLKKTHSRLRSDTALYVV